MKRRIFLTAMMLAIMLVAEAQPTKTKVIADEASAVPGKAS